MWRYDWIKLATAQESYPKLLALPQSNKAHMVECRPFLASKLTDLFRETSKST